MKNFASFAVFFLCCAFGLRAQTSDIIVFSEGGEKFTLLIDGATMNAEPAARVEARGIKNETPLLFVNFADASIPAIKQNGWMEPGQEYTLRITTNKKGQRVLRMQGQAPLGTTPAQSVATKPNNFVEDGVAKQELIGNDAAVQTTTHVSTTEHGVAQQVKIDMGAEGAGVTMTVNGGPGNVSTTTTTTTTTTYSQTGTAQTNDTPVPTTVKEEARTAVVDGCGQAMASGDFNEALESVRANNFEDGKLTVAKQIAQGNCLSTDQVVGVMGLFGFEDSKLDFAKFAYDHVSDRSKYFKVNKAFSFSGSVDELNSYIQSR